MSSPWFSEKVIWTRQSPTLKAEGQREWEAHLRAWCDLEQTEQEAVRRGRGSMSWEKAASASNMAALPSGVLRGLGSHSF